MDMDQKRVYWQGLIDQQSGSGQSVKRWCESNGIKEWQYYAWKARLQSKPRPSPDDQPGFVALDLPLGGKLSISFGRDIRIEASGECSLSHFRTALEVVCGARRCWR